MRILFSSGAVLFALTLATLDSGAFAAQPPSPPPELPAFDIAQRCEGAILVAGCIEKEHAALATLRFWWRRLDPGVKAECASEIRAEEVLNYTRLLACTAHRGHLPEIALVSAPIEASPTRPGGL